jgi:hypothetical protein
MYTGRAQQATPASAGLNQPPSKARTQASTHPNKVHKSRSDRPTRSGPVRQDNIFPTNRKASAISGGSSIILK